MHAGFNAISLGEDSIKEEDVANICHSALQHHVGMIGWEYSEISPISKNGTPEMVNRTGDSLVWWVIPPKRSPNP